MGEFGTKVDKGESSTKNDCWQLLHGDSCAEVAMEELKSFQTIDLLAIVVSLGHCKQRRKLGIAVCSASESVL